MHLSPKEEEVLIAAIKSIAPVDRLHDALLPLIWIFREAKDPKAIQRVVKEIESTINDFVGIRLELPKLPDYRINIKGMCKELVKRLDNVVWAITEEEAIQRIKEERIRDTKREFQRFYYTEFFSSRDIMLCYAFLQLLPMPGLEVPVEYPPGVDGFAMALHNAFESVFGDTPEEERHPPPPSYDMTPMFRISEKLSWYDKCLESLEVILIDVNLVISGVYNIERIEKHIERLKKRIRGSARVKYGHPDFVNEFVDAFEKIIFFYERGRSGEFESYLREDLPYLYYLREELLIEMYKQYLKKEGLWRV